MLHNRRGKAVKLDLQVDPVHGPDLACLFGGDARPSEHGQLWFALQPHRVR